MLGIEHSHAPLLSLTSFSLLSIHSPSKTFGRICMAQTVQRKQKRKKPPVVEAQDSTPPAPKRTKVTKVAQAQTARKSTGGREPSHRPHGGDDDDGDDDDGDDGRGGAPRAGPSHRRMWCSLCVADFGGLWSCGTGHIDASVTR